MPISFHDDKNKYSYTGRHADADWLKLVGPRLPGLKHAADVGCGGGVYSAALAELGAEAVRGVDFSKALVRLAKEIELRYAFQEKEEIAEKDRWTVWFAKVR